MGCGNTAAAGQGQFVARVWNAVVIWNQIIPTLFLFILQPPFFFAAVLSLTHSHAVRYQLPWSHTAVELLGLNLWGVRYSVLILCSSPHSRAASAEHSTLLSFLLSGTPQGQMIPLRFWISIMSASDKPSPSHSLSVTPAHCILQAVQQAFIFLSNSHTTS